MLEIIIEKTNRRVAATHTIVDSLLKYDSRSALTILASYLPVDRLEEVANQLQTSNKENYAARK